MENRTLENARREVDSAVKQKMIVRARHYGQYLMAHIFQCYTTASTSAINCTPAEPCVDRV